MVGAFGCVYLARYLQIALLSKTTNPSSSKTGTFPKGWSFMYAGSFCSFLEMSMGMWVYSRASSRRTTWTRAVDMAEP
jgi:hypothetical protein